MLVSEVNGFPRLHRQKLTDTSGNSQSLPNTTAPKGSGRKVSFFCVNPIYDLVPLTRYKFTLYPWYQVIFPQQQLIVQFRNIQISENSDAFENKFLIGLLYYRRGDISNEILLRKREKP